MVGSDTFSLDTDTVSSYINALKKNICYRKAPAWESKFKVKTAIRTSDTRYFIGPSIATASLGLGPKDLINDLNTFGLYLKHYVLEI